MKKYAFVNEKIVNGKTYRAYRNIDDPKDCYVEIDGKNVKVKNLKSFWRGIK